MPDEPEYYVEEVTELTPGLTERMSDLQRALQPGTVEESNEVMLLEEIIGQPSSAVLVIRDSDEVVGMLVVNFNYKLHYIEARIDDVVIDPNVQGQGLGTKLMQGALNWCKDHGAESVELTSRPSRVAANKLYLKLGFRLRETNVYKLHL